MRCENPGCAQSHRPALHVIVAEASAVSLAFSRSSGLSAMFGAPARFASQLMVDMANDIKQTYKEMGGEVYFHYLPMPMIFRSDGGLSTHWMLPSNVKFEQPLGVKRLKPMLDDSAITLSGEETRHLVDQLHDRKQSIEKDDELTKLWQWIDNDLYSNHQATWNKTIQCIKGDCKP